MTILDKILTLNEFVAKPPVLVDIGASGGLNTNWRKIAKYSICIGFDADDRETEFIEKENGIYKKLYVFNKIVAENIGKKEFYLTKSPYCSSTLKPDHEFLKHWSFAELFDVEKVVVLESVDLPAALKKLNIDYVDWFKTDSQGTDMRIFSSLGTEIINKVIIADFEPGMMDAYCGEDKLHSLMKFMENYPFWICDMSIDGTPRIGRDTLQKYFNGFQRKFMSLTLKKSPFWAEISYFNHFNKWGIFNKRDLLLGCAFAITKEQYGFALELSLIGQKTYNDPILKEIENYSIFKIKFNVYKVFFIRAKNIFRNILSNLK